MDAERDKSTPRKARPEVFGKTVDSQTRCVHYHGAQDIIAIRFRCCNRYYPCHACHEEDADHPAQQWPVSEWNSPAILCGACGTELTIHQYLNSGDQCPSCHAAFNPGCRNHYHLYFERAE